MPAQRSLSTPSHILFADDILIFVRVSRCNLRHLMRFIVEYGLNSSQLVNKSKPLVFLGKYACPRHTSIRNLLGIRLALPFKYVRVPISGVVPCVVTFKTL
ncbi:hypothetical protein ACFX13_009085 [Malus domestica]